MTVSEQVEAHIASYGDWRSERLGELKELIEAAAPELTQEFKWGVPVWTHNGLVCAVSGFKDHVKINFFKGAALDDKMGLFNSGLDSKDHRSINFAESDKIDKTGIAELVRHALVLNSK